jgi:hypothetical protein
VIVREVEIAGAGDNALEFAAPLSIGGKNWGVFLFAVSLRHVNEEVRFTCFWRSGRLIWSLDQRFYPDLVPEPAFYPAHHHLAAVMRQVDAENRSNTWRRSRAMTSWPGWPKTSMPWSPSESGQ